MRPSLLHRANRYVAAWQRRFPLFDRRQIRNHRPLACHGSRPLVVILCEPATRWDALWSLWSWRRFFAEPIGAAIFVDGPVERSWQDAAFQLFPGVGVESLPAWLETMGDPLQPFDDFRLHYPFARKLSLLVRLQHGGPFLYSDADVVALSDPTEVLQSLAAGNSAYMVDYSFPSVDPCIQKKSSACGWTVDPHLNSGLLVLGRHSLPEAMVAALLDSWRIEDFHRATEQTVVGALLPHQGGSPLPRGRYVISNRGMFFWERNLPLGGIAARHYTGNVRHRLYSQAYPELARQHRSGGTA